MFWYTLYNRDRFSALNSSKSLVYQIFIDEFIRCELLRLTQILSAADAGVHGHPHQAAMSGDRKSTTRIVLDANDPTLPLSVAPTCKRRSCMIRVVTHAQQQPQRRRQSVDCESISDVRKLLSIEFNYTES